MFKNAMVIVFLLVLIPIQVNAGASKVMEEGSAGGFHYKIVKENRTLLWEISHEKQKNTFQKNKENEEYLASYREAVNEAKSHRLILMASAGYFIVVCITTLMFYKKLNQTPGASGLIIACLLGVSLYYGITSFIDMHYAIRDAEVSYFRLMTL